MPRQHMNATARRSLTSSQKSSRNDTGSQQKSGSIIRFSKDPNIEGLSAHARRALAGKKVFIPEGVLSQQKGVLILALTFLQKHLPVKRLQSDHITIPKSAFTILHHCKQ